MTKKDKEEERIERIIRGLLKLPVNRRCINCNSLGPQYVCTTFNTFVCTNCSGVHREFTHRVKSVSMAKFNAEEVSSLQAGGNERARQIYFRSWDPQRNSYPDGSNLHRLRDFIKHVYVDRKFSGDTNHQNLPRLRMGGREEPNTSRNASAYHGSSTSPTYRNSFEQNEKFGSARRADERSVKYYYDERRSPRYSQENSRYGGFKKNPARFEIVDDRVRDDRRGRQSDSRRFSHRDSRSPDYQNTMNRSNSPVVRSMKDILGENVPRLQVGEHSKATGARQVNSSEIQMITSPVDTAPNGNSEKKIIQSSDSLIDLDTDSKNTDAPVAPQTQKNHPSNGGNYNGSANESPLKDNTPPAPKPNSLEILLLELSVPAVAHAASTNGNDAPSNDNFSSTESTGNVSGVVPPGQMLALLDNDGAPATGSGGNMLTGDVSAVPEGQIVTLPENSGASATVPEGQNMLVPSNAASDAPTSSLSPEAMAMETLTLLDSFDVATSTATSNSSDSTTNVPQEHQASSIQFHQLALPAPDGSPAEQQIPTTVAAANNQQLNPSNVHTAIGLSTYFAECHSQDASKLVQENNLVKSESLPAGITFGARKELPADLFTYSYSPVPVPMAGWQMGQNYGMAYGMQYYPQAMHPLASSNQAVSTNPFDCSDAATPVQAPQFPSMGNFQGVVPSPSYASGMPLRPPPFASAVSSGIYMGQQAHMNTPDSRPEAAGGQAGGSHSDPFVSLNIIQQPSSGYSLSTSSSLPSLEGNPFG